jgi:hypothetical protein
MLVAFLAPVCLCWGEMSFVKADEEHF